MYELPCPLPPKVKNAYSAVQWTRQSYRDYILAVFAGETHNVYPTYLAMHYECFVGYLFPQYTTSRTSVCQVSGEWSHIHDCEGKMLMLNLQVQLKHRLYGEISKKLTVNVLWGKSFSEQHLQNISVSLASYDMFYGFQLPCVRPCRPCVACRTMLITASRCPMEAL